MRSKNVVVQRIAVLAVLTATAACGSGGNGAGGPGGLGGTGGPGGGSGANPLYVVSTGILAGETFQGYLATVPSLDATASFNLDNALEIDASWIFNKPGQPYLYVASLFGPTIDRYTATAAGALVKDRTVSFANLGLEGASLAAYAPIYSDTKSYFVDDVQNQMVIWNPQEMTVIGAIPLGVSPEDGLPAAPEGTVTVHNGMIMTVVHWSNRDDDPSLYGSHVRLITIDPVTDTIVSAVDDARLTYAAPQARGADGSLYYSPGSFIAAEIEVAPGHGSPSHVLRLAPTAKAFDAAYDLDLSALVGGRPAGDFTLLDDRTAIIRAWHAELVDAVTPTTWKDVLWQQAGFMWWRWHVGDAQAVLIPNQMPGSLGSSVMSLDGKTYVLRTAADQVSTTLDEIDASGVFHPRLTGPGQFIGSVLRLR